LPSDYPQFHTVVPFRETLAVLACRAIFLTDYASLHPHYLQYMCIYSFIFIWLYIKVKDHFARETPVKQVQLSFVKAA
jgi:hypothetical protein